MNNRSQEIREARENGKEVIFVGLDVHKNNYQSFCFNPRTGEVIERNLKASTNAVTKLDKDLRKNFGEDAYILYGYESGPTGDKLKRSLDKLGIKCDIIPLRYVIVNRFNSQIKTDKRDAKAIATTLQYQMYEPVYVVDEEDFSVRCFIRMREDLVQEFKRVKQRIKSFLLARNLKRPGKTRNWSPEFLKWLHSVELNTMDRETLDTYLRFYYQYELELKSIDKRIKQIAQSERYKERVQRLRCFKGIDYLVALAVIVEIGDFNRFDKPGKLASYVGLVPGEYSSGSKVVKGRITKTGNKFLRKLLTLAAQGAVRGKRGKKSSHQSSKRKGSSKEMVLYAEKAEKRITDKFYHLLIGLKKERNIAITAVARELTNFIWGAMTDHIG